jgi:hypothetical protein
VRHPDSAQHIDPSLAFPVEAPGADVLLDPLWAAAELYTIQDLPDAPKAASRSFSQELSEEEDHELRESFTRDEMACWPSCGGPQ